MTAVIAKRTASGQPEESRDLTSVGPSSQLLELAIRQNVPVETLERLLVMHERMQATSAQQEYAAALSEMQDELPAIGERGKAIVQGQTRYTFALWEDINTAIKPVLKKHGFALSFRIESMEGGISVTGVLSHRDGHSERTTIPLPADASGSKNAVQAVASSVSYGKRYTAGALLNLTSHGEDDDAYMAAGEVDAAKTWLDAIEACVDMTGLNKVRDDIKAAGVSAKVRTRVQAAWQARAKAVKS